MLPASSIIATSATYVVYSVVMKMIRDNHAGEGSREGPSPVEQLPSDIPVRDIMDKAGGLARELKIPSFDPNLSSFLDSIPEDAFFCKRKPKEPWPQYFARIQPNVHPGAFLQ